MIRLSLVVIVLMACVACAGSEENLRPGPYVGLAVVGAGSNFDNFKDVDKDLNDGVMAPGLQALVGYQLWDRAALEVVYEGLMTFEGSDSDIDVDTAMLQAKLFFGVLPGEAFQIYAIGGAGWQWVSADGAIDAEGDGMAARGGLGLQWYLSENFPLFVEYTFNFAIDEDIEDFNYGSLKAGFLYRW